MRQKKKKISNWDYVLETPLFFLLPKCLSSKDCACQAEDTRDVVSIPGSRRFPWRRKWQSIPEFLPGKFHGQRSLVGYKVDMTEHTCTPSLVSYLFSQVIASAWSKPAYLTFSASHFAQGSLIAYVLSQNHEVWTREKINIFHIFKCSCSIMSTFFCQYWWY